MANPTSTESKLPAHASVVVIGGGVMGCSTLYHLGKMGVSDAILLERSELTSGTTWHSAAQVRALRSTRSMTDLIRYSVDLYRRLEEETGQATGWINKGSLSIATNPDRVTHIKRQQGLAELFDVRAQFVSAGEANERWPLMNTDDVIGAVWSPDDGRVGPSDLCAALVKGARASGARIFENTAVIGIETDAGRIRAVQTAQVELRATQLRCALVFGAGKPAQWRVSTCRFGRASTSICSRAPWKKYKATCQRYQTMTITCICVTIPVAYWSDALNQWAKRFHLIASATTLHSSCYRKTGITSSQ